MFEYGAKGKPFVKKCRSASRASLQTKLASRQIEFNLSHTKTAFAIVVSYEHIVGIDIEDITRKVDINGVAKQVFSADEITYLNALSDNEKQHAFYRCWTRKEAYVKALGIGIASANLRELTLTPEVKDLDCQLTDFVVEEKYLLAIALI